MPKPTTSQMTPIKTGDLFSLKKKYHNSYFGDHGKIIMCLKLVDTGGKANTMNILTIFPKFGMIMNFGLSEAEHRTYYDKI